MNFPKYCESELNSQINFFGKTQNPVTQGYCVHIKEIV